MKKSELKKLKKAKALMERARELVKEVEFKNKNFKNDGNKNFRDNRINDAISIIDSAIKEYE